MRQYNAYDTRKGNTMSPDTYKFNRDGVQEDVELQPWRWVATYNDGTELHQFDDKTKEFHQFQEIDQSKLVIFRMVSDDPNKYYSMLFNPENMKLIHFYKQYGLNFGTPDFRKVMLYVFGYENENGKHLMVITPHGELVITNDIANVTVG